MTAIACLRPGRTWDMLSAPIAFGLSSTKRQLIGCPPAGAAVMAAERWFIARNKTKVGPFSAGDLKQLARHGVLQNSEHVWLEGAGKWVEAGSLPGLFPKADEKKYWVAVAGQTRGPFIAAQIRAGLNAHQFTLENQACAVDARQWMKLGQFEEF